MVKSPIFYALLLLFAGFGCYTSNNKKKHIAINSLDSERNDSIAVARVENLPEYKHIITSFDKASTDTSHHIAILMDAEPTKEYNYYQLRLGEDAPDHFVDMELFYVDAKTWAVQHVDKETGNATTLDQWRKSGKDDWLK